MTMYKDRLYAFAERVSSERGLDDWEISDDYDDELLDCGCCACCGCDCDYEDE